MHLWGCSERDKARSCDVGIAALVGPGDGRASAGGRGVLRSNDEAIAKFEVRDRNNGHTNGQSLIDRLIDRSIKWKAGRVDGTLVTTHNMLSVV